MDLEWFRVHHYAKMEDFTVRICENQCISIFQESQKNTYWNKCSWSEDGPWWSRIIRGKRWWFIVDPRLLTRCLGRARHLQESSADLPPQVGFKNACVKKDWKFGTEIDRRCQHPGFLGCKLFPTLIRSQGGSTNPSVPMVLVVWMVWQPSLYFQLSSRHL